MATKPMPKIGVDYLHSVPIISNTAEGIIYAEANRLPGQVSASYESNSESNVFSADNGAYVSDVALGEQTVSLTVADVPLSYFAQHIGGDYDGSLNIGTNFAAKNVGLLYRIKFAAESGRNGYRYMRFWMGNFDIPNYDAETQEVGAINYQTSELSYTAIAPDSTGMYVQMIDDDNLDILAMGITPEILEAKIIDFNWNPFEGMKVSSLPVAAYAAPSVIFADTSGAISKPLMLGVTNTKFAATIAPADITIDTLPSGLTLGKISRINDVVVSVQIDGAATEHASSDSVSGLSVKIAQTALAEASGELVSSQFGINFVD